MPVTAEFRVPDDLKMKRANTNVPALTKALEGEEGLSRKYAEEVCEACDICYRTLETAIQGNSSGRTLAYLGEHLKDDPYAFVLLDKPALSPNQRTYKRELSGYLKSREFRERVRQEGGRRSVPIKAAVWADREEILRKLEFSEDARTAVCEELCEEGALACYQSVFYAAERSVDEKIVRLRTRLSLEEMFLYQRSEDKFSKNAACRARFFNADKDQEDAISNLVKAFMELNKTGDVVLVERVDACFRHDNSFHAAAAIGDEDAEDLFWNYLDGFREEGTATIRIATSGQNGIVTDPKAVQIIKDTIARFIDDLTEIRERKNAISSMRDKAGFEHLRRSLVLHAVNTMDLVRANQAVRGEEVAEEMMSLGEFWKIDREGA